MATFPTTRPASSNIWGSKPTDRVLYVLPFLLSYGSSVLHTHLAVGATVVIEDQLVFPQRVAGADGRRAHYRLRWRAIDVRAAAQAGDCSEFDLASLRYVTQAGGAMPRRRSDGCARRCRRRSCS